MSRVSVCCLQARRDLAAAGDCSRDAGDRPVVGGDRDDLAPHPREVDVEHPGEHLGDLAEQAVPLLDGPRLEDDRGEEGRRQPPFADVDAGDRHVAWVVVYDEDPDALERRLEHLGVDPGDLGADLAALLGVLPVTWTWATGMGAPLGRRGSADAAQDAAVGVEDVAVQRPGLRVQEGLDEPGDVVTSP